MEDFLPHTPVLPPYVFEQVNRGQGRPHGMPEPISSIFGMGNPDLPTPPHVIEKLKETLGENRGPTAIPRRAELLACARAQAAYYDRRFRASSSTPKPRSSRRWARRRASPTWRKRSPRPVMSCCVLIRAIRSMPSDFLMAGGVIRSVPSEPTPQFFEAVEARHRPFDPESRWRLWSVIPPIRPPMSRASISTGDLVAFAKKHEIFILSDLAYAEVLFRRRPTRRPSVLQVSRPRSM